jgi:hypothetical protein
MLRRYRFWLIAAVLFMFLTAGLHSISFFVDPEITNDTQRQLHELLHNYREDMGAGFNRSFFDLFTALSACYPLLCMMGGLTLGYLLMKHTEPSVMKGVLGIHLAIFLVCLIIMIFFTFLPPIVMTALIVLNVALAYILCPNIESAVDL